MPELVFGIDPALQNTGWCCWQVDLHNPIKLHYFIGGNTLRETDTSYPVVERLDSMAERTWRLLDQYRPDLVVLEGPILNGARRSTTGAALYSLLTLPLRRKALGDTLWGQYRPRGVVTFNPSRLYGLLRERYKKPPTAAANKDLYRQETGMTHSLTEHEVDAYWLAHFGLRFWRTCVEDSHSRDVLTPKEQETFLFSTKISRKKELVETGMLDQPGDSWWNPESVEGSRRVLSFGDAPSKP